LSLIRLNAEVVRGTRLIADEKYNSFRFAALSFLTHAPQREMSCLWKTSNRR
jgi:hypothetical protein